MTHAQQELEAQIAEMLRVFCKLNLVEISILSDAAEDVITMPKALGPELDYEIAIFPALLGFDLELVNTTAANWVRPGDAGCVQLELGMRVVLPPALMNCFRNNAEHPLFDHMDFALTGYAMFTWLRLCCGYGFAEHCSKTCMTRHI